MITPVCIRVRNIRSVAEGEISVDPTGITALHGPIGAGKSTFLDALVWVLYGEVPGGLKQAEMRRTGADKHTCEAEVDFLVNGQTYTAARGLRQRTFKGRVREEAYARWIPPSEDRARKPERQISPSKLTLKITELTGLSGRAYTGALFIAQGQLAALAEGTPAHVQSLFEEQTGLGALSKKVEEAKATARRVAEQATAMPGSREEHDTAREARDTAQEAAAAAQETHTDTTRALVERRDALTTAEHEVTRLDEQRRAAERVRIERARADERLMHCRQRADAITNRIRSEPPVPEAPDILAEQLRVLRECLDAAEHARSQASDRDQLARRAAARAEEARANAQQLHDPDTDRHIATASSEMTRYEQQRGALKGEYRRLKRSLDELQAAWDHSRSASCPTCTQPLRNIRALVAALRQQLDRCIANGRTAARKADAATQLHQSLLSSRDKANAAHTTWATARNETQLARTTAESASRTADEQDARLAALLPDATRSRDLSGMRRHARERVEDHTQRLAAAQKVQSLRAELGMAQRELDRAQQKADQMERPTALDVDDDLARARTQRDTARAEQERQSTLANEASTGFKVAVERATLLGDAYDKAQAQMRAKADQLRRADVMHHAAEALAELRRTLLAEYTAQVSQAATDVLTQITDRYVRFEIDEEFVPRVHTPEGNVRPTRVLSGGEKATAALAFRLGITSQITQGNANGMIIADEITAAHDADSRQAVLACLTELGWPALIVSHGEEITELAPTVINFSQPDERTGTVIAAAA